VRALVWYGIEEVRVQDVAEPRIADPRDALVEVELAGVCGSDLHVYHGRETGLDPGTVLGHEFVGRIVEAGADVGLEAGTRVVGPFTTSCGACFFCERDLPSRCIRGRLLGWVQSGRGLQGAQAERVRIPLADTTLVPVPAAVPSREALLTGDVAATGQFAADLAGVGPSDVAVVLGCGPVGLSAVHAACQRRAAAVLAVDAVPDRLALAARLGAQPVELEQDPLASVHAATAGRGADAVLECVGSSAAGRLALDLVRAGGTIAAVGVHTEPRFAFAPGEAYDKNLTYRAGRCPARRYIEPLLARLAASPIGLAATIVSHEIPLEEGREGYALFAGRRGACTKVLLAP